MHAHRILLYERTGCGLCEEAARLLAPLARELGFALRRVDIESDEALLRRYDWAVPVVALEDGRELGRAPFEAASLRRALAAVLAEVR